MDKIEYEAKRAILYGDLKVKQKMVAEAKNKLRAFDRKSIDEIDSDMMHIEDKVDEIRRLAREDSNESE